ncbi:DNA (cytosine-5-)-methyltransferase [Bacillus inaquosorum]|uniref:DNA (cytosine-5-)-methyltransferase n=1 Tax=Bacillus inaquosorum TaxID=483913 RepID=UPI0022821312|nr:DNA (cytosine-5-)-methyltransferase [Bacillus inaquosorum]MCY8798167.1 DNA (cytosine-5-)-methyltransferase [Bacillus inaquosorum]MEC0772919.1 DNA (cytosine-5-)-methyltransferase [Bacillus inaquosorum]MEC0797032.1 DNA (cytosine-5-)-methyltransferase [Bacillus inaquosorum]
MNKLRVMSLFSGIGAFEAALRNIGVEYELVGFSEIDKYAIKSYCAIHNVDEQLNYCDVSKIDKTFLPEFDLLVGGSPCQSFSIAGHRRGFEDTRGTLFFQYIETLKEKQPKFFIFENVKGLINHDKGNTLNVMAEAFSEVGYRIDLELLNSKFFNVPQNRERIYIIGIREDLIENDEWFLDKGRNDVLSKGKKRLKELNIKSFTFRWPLQVVVGKRLREILEDYVDEKYYLSEKKTKGLIAELERNGVKEINDSTGCKLVGRVNINGHDQKKRVYSTNGLCPTPSGLGIGGNTEPKILEIDPVMVGHVDIKGHDAIKRVYSPEGVSPTLTTMGGGHREPKIAIEQFSFGDGVSCCLDANYTKGTSPGEVGKGRRTHIIEKEIMTREYSRRTGIGKELEVSHTLSASDWRGLNRNQKQNAVVEVRPVLTPEREEKRQNGRRFKDDGEPAFTVNTIDRHGVAIGEYPKYRIRKLTPLECFRLQAFDDEDFENAFAAGISNSQLYKQAGNSITVTVLESIFKELIHTYVNKESE